MTDAQTWTLIIGFLAVLVAVVTFTSTMTLRVIRSEFVSVHTRIDGVEQRLGDRLDRLDRDVQAVLNRLMGG